MLNRLTVKPLDRREVEQAYPLVEALHPEVTLADWRHFAAERIAAAPAGRRTENRDSSDPAESQPHRSTTSGILAAVLGARTIYGLAAYVIRDTLCHGRTLIVEEFVALALLDTESVISSLLEKIEEVAREHGCAAIHIQLPRGGRLAEQLANHPGAKVLVEAGHHPDAVVYCKPLEPQAGCGTVTPGAPRRAEPAN